MNLLDAGTEDIRVTWQNGNIHLAVIDGELVDTPWSEISAKDHSRFFRYGGGRIMAANYFDPRIVLGYHDVEEYDQGTSKN